LDHVFDHPLPPAIPTEAPVALLPREGRRELERGVLGSGRVTLTFRPRTIPTVQALLPFLEGGDNGNWNKAPGSGRNPHPSPWTIPTQAPVGLLPREGTTGTGRVLDPVHWPYLYPTIPTQAPTALLPTEGTTGTGTRLQDRVETLTFPLGPYPRRLPLPFSRGRVQRELDKSNWMASLTLAIYPGHTQAGSRCPSPEGGYNGNWDKAPGSGRDPHPSPWTIPTEAPVALLPREGTTGTGRATGSRR